MDNNDVMLKLCVKGFSHCLYLLKERGMAFIDSETDKHYVVYMDVENSRMVLDETTNVERDCSFVKLEVSEEIEDSE